MNPEQELIFAFLEEDNIQRAYFRVRPLLTVNGDVREEADKMWPNEGCLRIVPDKNEQHTFKERMRNIGSWCMVDLTGYAPEANKVRTNKNFRPDRGETNQFILYSNTVKSLPETVFYEVLDGAPEDHQRLAQASITPRFYIRQDDTLYGPVARSSTDAPAPAGETEATLYEMILPDEKQHTILCIPSENKITERAPAQPRAKAARGSAPADPAPTAQEEPETLPIGQALNILDQSQTFEETLHGLSQPLSERANLLHEQGTQALQAPFADKPAAPLTGTPLFRAPLHTSTPQAKNKLQEVVSTQVRVVRNDPPAEPLPSGARLTQVDNPVETACQTLKRAWQLTDSRRQLASFILSLDGMRSHLLMDPSDTPSPLYHAIQQQLQDLEAERLSVLVQLDKAQADADAYRKSTIDAASAKAKAELTRLEARKEELAASIGQLKEQLNLLIAQREEQASRLDALKQQAIPEVIAKVLADAGVSVPGPGTTLRLSPVCGAETPVEQVLARVEQVCAKVKVPYVRNRAIALLTLLAVSDRIGIVSGTPAAAATLAQDLVDTLGWGPGFAHQVTIDQKPVVCASPADGTPALLMTSLAHYAPVDGLCKLLLAKNAGLLVRNAAYEADPWPVFPLAALPFIPALSAAPGTPISAASLDALLAHPVEESVVETAMQPILALCMPLSGRAQKAMVRFAAACAATMDGGLAAACDWAVTLWVLPNVERSARMVSALKPLLAEYPMSAAAL